VKSVNPYLNFNDNTEEAFTFYRSVFGGELQIDRYKDLDDNMGATGDELNKIANVMLPIGGGTMLFGSDVLGRSRENHSAGNNFYIQLETDSEEETEQLFEKLSNGGTIQMPLANTGWAKQFGMFTDKFGIQWMVYYPG
jgi:PhnB protein